MADVINELISKKDKVDVKYLKELNSHNFDFETSKKCVKILCEIYFVKSSKQPEKKIILGSLKSLQSKHPNLVQKELNSILGHQLSKENTFNHLNRPELIESISSLLESSPLGSNAIRDHYIQVVKFLQESLKYFWNMYENAATVVESQLAISHCQTSVKTLVCILQKLDCFAVEKVEALIILLKIILENILQILNNETVFLTFRGNCGMASCLLITTVYGPSNCINALRNLSIQSALSNVQKIDGIEPELPVLPDMSILMLFSGALLTISHSNIMMHNVLIDTFLQSILKLSERSKEASELLQVSRVLFLWTEKTKIFIQKFEVESLKEAIKENGDVNLVMDYVWTHCEHFVDGVRHQCKDIFKNVLTIIILTSDDKGNHLLQRIIKSVLDMSWTRRGKYNLLVCIVDLLDSSEMLETNPRIPYDVLNGINEHALTSHGSELYQKLAQSSLVHTKNDDGKFEWFKIWVTPVIKCLKYPNNFQKAAIIQYILPAMIKKNPAIVDFLVSQFKATHLDVDVSITTLLTCLRIARSQGIIKNSTGGDSALWGNIVPYDVLDRGLCHNSDQVRLDVLLLLCESFKTAEPMQKVELDIISKFIPANLTSQSPAFRQNLIAAIKKLFTRLYESSLQVVKKKSLILKNPKNEAKFQINFEIVDHYQTFIDELCSCMVGNLFYAANFPRRGTVLQILFELKKVFRQNNSVINLKALYNPEAAQVLLISLMDTYDNNRIILLDLLKSFSAEESGLQTKETMSELLQSALTLVSCPRPQDSATATYLLMLISTFDIRQTLEEYINLNNITVDMSLRNPCLIILRILQWKLHQETEVAKRDFIHAAATGPLYGILSCIRKVVNEINFNDHMDDKKEWKMFIEELINSAVNVSSIVCPIVSNASPEGHIPADDDPDKGDVLKHAAKIIKEAQVDEESEAVVTPTKSGKLTGVTAQIILLCSWRAHKEVSLLFGELAKALPIMSVENDTKNLLTEKQLFMMGDYFREQLIYTKHRGAFEQSYVGFCDLCQCLWRSNIKSLYEMPSKWLNALMDDILRNESNASHLCATRRSAGLPFMFLAILVTEISVGKSACLSFSMKELIQMAKADYDENSSEFRVHALNILRAMYRETKLGEAVMPYVASGVEVALLGFQAKSWAVRNSATLLFSALMTRIFGVNRSKDTVDRKNCLTARVFFSRFPTLFEVILSFFKSSAEAITTFHKLDFNPVMYPILLLLGRLNPSATVGSDSNISLAEFLPYVQKCAASPILKTRVLAAQAIVPLISISNVEDAVEALLLTLPSIKESINQNQIHGILLQLKNILNSISSSTKKLEEVQMIVRKYIESKLWLLMPLNLCCYTRIEFCEFLMICFKLKLLSANDSMVRTLIQDLLEDPMLYKKSISYPGSEMFATTIISMILNLSSEIDEKLVVTSICRFLKSEIYEARLTVLHFLKDVTCSKSKDVVNSSIESLVFKLTNGFPHDNIEGILSSAEEIAQNLVLIMNNPKEHSACSVEATIIVGMIPQAIIMPWICTSFTLTSPHQKLKFILEKLQQNLREDLFCSLLRLSGKVVKEFDLHGINIETEVLLKKWAHHILLASDSNKSMCYRDTAASVLCDNYLMLLKVSAVSNFVNLWTATLILLQDDESFIREKTASVVDDMILYDLNDDLRKNFLPMQPVVATGKLVQLFIQCFSTRHDILLSALTSWILNLKSHEISEELELNDESPFDKGEMNMYYESTTITQVILKHLRTLMCDVKLQLNLNSTFSDEFSNFLCVDGQITFEKFIKDLIMRIDSLILELNESTRQSLFLSRNFDIICLELQQKYSLLNLLNDVWSTGVLCPVNNIFKPKFANPTLTEVLNLNEKFRQHS